VGVAGGPMGGTCLSLSRSLERALRCQLLLDYKGCEAALVAASYVLPVAGRSDGGPGLRVGEPLYLYLCEVLAYWLAQLRLHHPPADAPPTRRFGDAALAICLFLFPEAVGVAAKNSSRALTLTKLHATAPAPGKLVETPSHKAPTSSLAGTAVRLKTAFTPEALVDTETRGRRDALHACLANLLAFVGTLQMHVQAIPEDVGSASLSHHLAVDAFDLALQLQPANLVALYNRASAYHLTGRFQHTVANYSALLEVLSQPEHNPSQGQLALCGVLSEYTRLLSKDPKTHWGRIPQLQGTLAKALEVVWKEQHPTTDDPMHAAARARPAAELSAACSTAIAHMLRDAQLLTADPATARLAPAPAPARATQERFDQVFQQSLAQVERMFAADDPSNARHARARKGSRPRAGAGVGSGSVSARGSRPGSRSRRPLSGLSSAAAAAAGDLGGQGSEAGSARRSHPGAQSDSTSRRPSSTSRSRPSSGRRGGDGPVGSAPRDAVRAAEEATPTGKAFPTEKMSEAMAGGQLLSGVGFAGSNGLTVQLTGVAGRLQNIREVQQVFQGLPLDDGHFFDHFGRRLSQQREVPTHSALLTTGITRASRIRSSLSAKAFCGSGSWTRRGARTSRRKTNNIKYNDQIITATTTTD
jgi:hypothetical protein